MNSINMELTGFSVARLADTSPEGILPLLEGLDWIPAKPGRAIHYDLIEAGRLDNPYAGYEWAVKSKYVPQSDWIYRASFDLPKNMADASNLFIELECVDTFADVYVNGMLVGVCNNMFMPWRFDLSKADVKEEFNLLLVHIKGHGRMVADMADEAEDKISCDGRAPEWARERSLVRRYQRSYAEDFCYVGQGIWGIGLVRPVKILAFPEAYIKEYEFVVNSVGLPACAKASASVSIMVDSAKFDGRLAAKAVLSHQDGSLAAQSEISVVDGIGTINLDISSPKLWWPHSYGDQYLYKLKIILYNESIELHTVTCEVGLKEVKLCLKKDDGRQDFSFYINGKLIYARGSNLIPVDVLNAGGTPQQVEDLLKLAINANMNMMRLWGGGMPEPDWYYSLCDRYGILLWKDAHLHSHTYPDYNEQFNEQVRLETIVMIKQLRSHPCFVLFSGGNEQQEGWDAWSWKTMHDRFYGSRLIYDILPKLGAEYCPEIPYIPNSPYGEKLSQSPVDGDTHTWGNFINATEDPLFVTETCWYNGTISRPETLEKWMGIKADDFAGLRWQRKWKDLTTHSLWNVNQYSEYHMDSGLRQYARGLEIEQMTADYMALYYLRVRSPSCNGILYWPFNKGGPMMNYGCIDYSGYPLMPYYLCVRLYKEQVIHVYRDCADIRVKVTNDGDPFKAKLKLTLFDTVTGETINQEISDVTVSRGGAQSLYTQGSWYGEMKNRWREAVHAQLECNGTIVSEDFLLFCPLYELETGSAVITVTQTKINSTEWELEVCSDHFIKLLELECNARVMFSDNYFMLMPGVTRRLRLTVLGDRCAELELTTRALDYDISEKVILC